MEVAYIILGILAIISIYININLYKKLLKQEEVIESQVDYLRKVSYIIVESKMYIDKLDEAGTFRSDDEIGTFFDFMKEIQGLINEYRLPPDYGKSKKEK